MDPGYSELLRLDLDGRADAARGAEAARPCSPDDKAGWPNGRRPRDDVTDVAVRAVGGPNYIAARAGDGVNIDDAPLPSSFPFLADPGGRARNYNVPGDGHDAASGSGEREGRRMTKTRVLRRWDGGGDGRHRSPSSAASSPATDRTRAGAAPLPTPSPRPATEASVSRRSRQPGRGASPRDVESLVALGLAYQQRARETGDPSWYPKSAGVLRRARASGARSRVAAQRARLARAGAAPVPRGARASGGAPSRSQPGERTRLGRGRRRARRARPLRGGVRGVRPDGGARARRRPRTRASRTRASCSAGRAAAIAAMRLAVEGRRLRAEATRGRASSSASSTVRSDGSGRRARAATASRSRVPGLRPRARRPRAGRGRARDVGTGDRPRAARGRA